MTCAKTSVRGASTKHFYADGLQVAKMVNGAVYYLHEDALASVRLVATATVTITFSSNYAPYGSSYAMTGKEVFMYTGKPYDSTTGLYYYGARYYDDSIGRFVTEDSYAGDKNDPLSLNRYAYARDNPEKYNGPSGHFIGHSSIMEGGSDPAFLATLVPITTPGGQAVYVTPGTVLTFITPTTTTTITTMPIPHGALVVTTTIQTPTIGLGGPTQQTVSSGWTCNGSPSYCAEMSVGGTNIAEKALVGSGITIFSVGLLVYSMGTAEVPFLISPGGQTVPNPVQTVSPPETPATPGPVSWGVYGLQLVGSAFAQLGCEVAGICSS